MASNLHKPKNQADSEAFMPQQVKCALKLKKERSKTNRRQNHNIKVEKLGAQLCSKEDCLKSIKLLSSPVKQKSSRPKSFSNPVDLEKHHRNYSNLFQINDQHDVLSRFSKFHIEALLKENKRNKNYMFMVIHDMRNPTVAIR